MIASIVTIVVELSQEIPIDRDTTFRLHAETH